MSNLKIFAGGFRKGFKDFSDLIANIVNFVLLSVVYFIGVGIVALGSRIVGKKFLNLKSGENSSWVKRNLSKMPMEEYRRMF